MQSMGEQVTYSDIYDPAENPGHIGHRWIYDNGQLPDGTPVTYKRFAHYEGYGGRSSEKSTFISSINRFTDASEIKKNIEKDSNQYET